MKERPYFVHESSYVDEPCDIGEGTMIWHFCHIMKRGRCILRTVVRVYERADAARGSNL